MSDIFNSRARRDWARAKNNLNNVMLFKAASADPDIGNRKDPKFDEMKARVSSFVEEMDEWFNAPTP